jgi:hypothetical protein
MRVYLSGTAGLRSVHIDGEGTADALGLLDRRRIDTGVGMLRLSWANPRSDLTMSEGEQVEADASPQSLVERSPA